MTQTPAHPPAAPPREPGTLGYAPAPAASTWPKVIGIITIVWAIFEILAGGCGVLGMLFSGVLSGLMPQGQMTGMKWATEEWMGWMVGLNILNAATAVLLLVGGIALLRRRRGCVKLLCSWAVIKIFMGMFNAVLGYLIQTTTFETMSQDPNLGAAMGGGVVKVFSVYSIAFGLLWSWALPIFMLIWLGRNSIRAEIATWSPGQFPVDAPGSTVP